MQIEDFLKLVRKRRSIRSFKPDAVPDDDIEKILEAARWAMSGANGQPWQFIVVKDQTTRSKMAEIYRRDNDLVGLVEFTRLPDYRQPRWRHLVSTEILWKDAPVIIVVLGDPRTVMASALGGKFSMRHMYEQNMSNVTHMICLAAAALGLGAEWVSISITPSEELKPFLGVPARLDIFTLVPIGYPAQEPTGYRRELSELVSYEKYDMSRFMSDEEVQEFIKQLRSRHRESAAYPDAEQAQA